MGDPLPDDDRLLRAIQRGDREAFRALYERYGGRVLAYARRMTRDEPQLAEDVTQEVFLRVWRRAATFRPRRGDVAGWLFTIVRHCAIDHWRRRPAARRVEDFELDLTAAPPEVAREENLSLRQALERLEHPQREAIALAYFGGLSYEETAARLSLPVGTLKSRIRAGLKRLRAALSTDRGSIVDPARR